MNKVLKQIVEMTIKLMEFKTVKGKFKEFDKAFDYIKKNIDGYFIKEIVVNGYKNLFISNTEDTNLDVIFCGHIDVVASLEYKAIIKDGKIYGRGSFDMKGQLAVMIELLKNKSDKKIALIITSDEEIGGACCKEILKNYDAKLAVVPDAGKNFSLITLEKGLLQLEITTKGIKSHASEPYKGDNAIVKNINIYNKLLEKYKMPKNGEFVTTVNLSKIEGGSDINTVADTSKMILDIRFTSSDVKEDIIKFIKNISKDSTIDILDYGPMFFADVDNPLIVKFMENYKKIMNKDITTGKCVATSDAIYFSEKGIPTILINPIGDFWHSPYEYAVIDSYYTLYLLFKTLI